MTKMPFPKGEERSDREVLSLVHSDLMGAHHLSNLGQNQYVLTFIDDKSRRALIYLIKRKDETLNQFKS